MVSVTKNLLSEIDFQNVQWFCYNKFIDVTDTMKHTHERAIWDRNLVSDYNKTTIMQVGMFGENEFVHKQYNPYSHKEFPVQIADKKVYEEIPYSVEELNVYFQPLVRRIFEMKQEFVTTFDSDFDYLDIHCYKWNSPGGGIDWHNDPARAYDLDENEQEIFNAKQILRVGAGSFYVHSTWMDRWHGELLIEAGEDAPQGEVIDGWWIKPTPNKLVTLRTGINHRVAKTSNMAMDRLSLQIWFSKAIRS